MLPRPPSACVLFFFNDTATTEIYTLPLHDALPISLLLPARRRAFRLQPRVVDRECLAFTKRSEEHTSELQSQSNLVCRLLLEKKQALAAFPAGPRSAARSTL